MNQGDPPLAIQGTCTGTGTVSYGLVSGPSHGSLVGNSSGSATYTPNVLFAGTDQFTYRATDSDGHSTDATVAITVVGTPGTDLPPSCPNPVQAYVPENGTVTIKGACSDPEGGPISYGINSTPVGGFAQIILPDTVVYGPPPVGVSSTSFNYSATDSGSNTFVGQVLISVLPSGTDTVATAPEATSTTPLVAGVQSNPDTPVVIGARQVSSPPPANYFFLGTEFDIDAPTQTAANPLRLMFTVDASAIPLSGEVIAFRDGTPIDQPCDGPGVAEPDPCIESSGPVGTDGDHQIVILSSHASVWHLGYAASRTPTTKDDCKNGGWRDVRDDGGDPFKNQGDCVSWVARR
jgi:hypothetical protein